MECRNLRAEMARNGIRAQRAINDAHASIANGLICGQVC